MIRRLGRLAFPLAAVLSMTAGVCQAQTVIMRQVRPAVRNGKAKLVGHMPANQVMHLVLTLPLRNQDQLQQFLKEVYDPHSPMYRHFLTVNEFTAQYGPTQQEYNQLIDFAKSNGFTVTRTTPNRVNLNVSGSVASVEKAFNVTMNIYRHPNKARNFYGPNKQPSTYLPFSLWHIAGLDNYSIPHPMYVRKSVNTGSNTSTKSNATTGSGPSASFLGSDMRAAYYGGSTLTGAGQSIGLVEFAGTDLTDLDTYYKNIGQTNHVPITLLSTDGTSTVCEYNHRDHNCDDTEQTIDMTQALGMAPGLSSLVMYIGSTDASIFDAMATASPLNPELSCSWSWSPDDPGTDDPYFEEFAAQGQDLFVAAGDYYSWNEPIISSEYPYFYPAEDGHVTTVGGTDLTTKSAGGAWDSGVVWPETGGGISPDDIPIPSWQQTAAAGCKSCSTVYRNGPDVAANANYTFYVCADQTACTANQYGGTSFAAPMWAGYLALINEQSEANGDGLVGFINPALYSIGESGAYSTDFHDITSGTNYFTATTGYDLATGWGSPNGTALITSLAGASTPSFSLSASPTSLSLAPGGSGSSTISFTGSGGFSGTVSLGATTSSADLTVGFSSTQISGTETSAMTVSVAAGTPSGQYTVTVKGSSTTTSGTITSSTTVTVNVATPSFTLSASPTSLSLAPGGSGNSGISFTPSGGFSGTISLTATPSSPDLGVQLSSTSISASSPDSTLTVNVAAGTPAGQYTVAVKGTSTTTSGTITSSTTVTVNVAAAATGSFTLSAASPTLTVVKGNSGTDVITVAVTGTLSAPISLSASGQPGAVTVNFSPSSVSASGGPSTMTVTVPNGGGSHVITITGTSGSVTSSTNVTLNITK